MYPAITPVLVFDRNAEEAMRFYVSLFPYSKITEISYSKNEGAKQNDHVQKARLSLNGQEFVCKDRKSEHNLGEGQTSNLYVDCASRVAMLNLFEALSQGGKIILPITRKNNNNFGQVQDKFGILWQLNAQTGEDDFTEGNVCFANSSEVRPEYRE